MYTIEIQDQINGKLGNWRTISIGGSAAYKFATVEKAERAIHWLYPQNPPWVRVAHQPDNCS